jgi:hypothetical protein
MFGCSKSSNSTPANNPDVDTVIYSNWTAFANMTPDPNVDSFADETITAAAITQTVLNQDAIFFYVQYQGQVYVAEDFGIFPSYAVGTISVLSEDGNLDGTGVMYRYVIVPGKVATTAFKGMTKAQLQSLSYKELTSLVSSAKQAASPGIQ